MTDKENEELSYIEAVEKRAELEEQGPHTLYASRVDDPEPEPVLETSLYVFIDDAKIPDIVQFAVDNGISPEVGLELIKKIMESIEISQGTPEGEEEGAGS